jgi:biopolymer transport protein ExbB
MIQVFQKIGVSKNPSVHSAAIGLALFATALGLMTAIPLVFAHVLFKAWVAKFEVKMKSAAQRLLVLVQAAKPAAGASTAVQTQPAVAAPTGAARR